MEVKSEIKVEKKSRSQLRRAEDCKSLKKDKKRETEREREIMSKAWCSVQSFHIMDAGIYVHR